MHRANDKGERMNELELFAGAGGGILGSMLLGHRTVCAVEYDAYARSVLLARQADGTFPHFPIWDDVRTFDGNPWRGIVDVVSGGFPCQDISVAGRGAGLGGERSGLWSEMARIVREVQPRYVFIENSPALVTRGLDRVLADLAKMGFDARWGCISAGDCGAPHERDRIWILANSNCWHDKRRQSEGSGLFHAQKRKGTNNYVSGSGEGCKNVAYANSAQCEGNERAKRSVAKHANPGKHCRWPAEPELDRVANGVANRTHRLKAIGNGQVPRVRAIAWETLMGKC